MMAAAPLLRALRAPTLRGPLRPWRPPLGLGPAPRGLASAQAAAVGQSPSPPPGLAPPPPGGPTPSQPPTGQPPPPPPGLAPPLGVQDAPGGDEAPLEGGGEGLGGEGLVGEGRLADLGLGAMTPVGLIQNGLEFLHLQLGLPWWGAIAVGTLGARVALLPLLLRAQREAARLAAHAPHIQRLAQRLAQARRGSDQYQVARAYSELAAYQKRHDVNPLRGFLVPLVQTPLFVSFFLALQQMAAAPVPGFRAGGPSWCPDLTTPDPHRLLPLLVTASTWLVLEVGAETGVASPGAGAMRHALRLLPLLFLPFILHFPAAVFTYWLTSNAFSLAQTGLLRLPALRARLGVAPRPAPGPAPSSAPRGLLARLRQEWREAQATQRGEERQWRLRNHLRLAAKGPLRQTFAQNPLPAPPPPAPPAPPKRPWKETLG